MIPQLRLQLTLCVDSSLTRQYDSRHPKKWMIKQVHAQKFEVTRDSRLDTAVKQRVNDRDTQTLTSHLKPPQQIS